MANNLMIRLPELKSEVRISKEWFEERDILISEASMIDTVRGNEDFNQGALILNKITKTSNNLEKMRKALSKPFNDSLRLIKTASEKARGPLETAKFDLKTKLAAYAEHQAQQYEQEEKLLASIRQETLQQDKLLTELAVQEFGSSDTELFNSIDPELKNRVEKAKSSSVAVKNRISFEILDESKIPGEFMTPDESKIRAWISLNKQIIHDALKADENYSTAAIPGLKLKLETDITAR